MEARDELSRPYSIRKMKRGVRNTPRMKRTVLIRVSLGYLMLSVNPNTVVPSIMLSS